jgi:hypothetical protein
MSNILFNNNNLIMLVTGVTTSGIGSGNNKVMLESPHSVGDSWAGGIVAYISGDGYHGFVISPQIGSDVPWGCNTTLLPGTFISGIGNGVTDTNLMISGCPSAPAACACTGYTGGGYTDWVLPNVEELQQIMNNHTILGLSDDYYWTSVQYNTTNASVGMWNPRIQIGYTDKSDSSQIRAIRYF